MPTPTTVALNVAVPGGPAVAVDQQSANSPFGANAEMSISELAFSSDGVQDSTPVTGNNPSPVKDERAALSRDQILAATLALVDLTTGMLAQLTSIGMTRYIVSGPESFLAKAVRYTVGTATTIVWPGGSCVELKIVNVGTTRIYLGIGGVTPVGAGGVYSVPLSACTAVDDGTGGSFTTTLDHGAILAISNATGGAVVVTASF